MEDPNKIFLFGLDNAGKTTLLKYLREGKVIESSTPTKSFNIMDMFIEEQDFVVWDAPGQVDYRIKWKKGVGGSDIMVFLVDTADSVRFGEAKEELGTVLNEYDDQYLPLIVCFHKMDLEESKANLEAAKETIDLSGIKGRQVNWVTTSIFTNDGIEDFKMMIYFSLIISKTREKLKKVQEKY